jgi:hypothetical protein
MTVAVGLAVAGFCLAGCGGTDEGRLKGDSYEVPSGNLVGCELANSLELTLIAGGDFESLVAQWGSRSDGSTTDVKLVCPQDSTKPCAAEAASAGELTGELGGSVYTGVLATFAAPLPKGCSLGERGAHLRAEGLYNWGGQLYRDFSQSPVDASGYDGIAFWAKLGQEGLGRSVFIAFEDKYTREDSYKLTDKDGNPVIDEETGQQKSYCTDSSVDTEKCDRFGAGVGLEEAWRYIKVPFSSVQQRGYGRASDHLHTEELLGIAVYFDVGDWDFWMDEISFYKEKE